jgi:hypothetical protein
MNFDAVMTVRRAIPVTILELSMAYSGLKYIPAAIPRYRIVNPSFSRPIVNIARRTMRNKNQFGS